MTTPVNIPKRRHPEPPREPIVDPAGLEAFLGAVRGRARLVRFFSSLAIKERLAPQLHVRPLVAEMFMTDNCNLTCTSCGCWREHTRNELSTAEWRGVIDQLAELGFLKLNFTGGEPLIRRDAVGLMHYARSVGIPDIHLNTNAILLDKAKCAEVLAAGVRSFNISIDGPDAATHDAIRGPDGSFDTTIANLRHLLDQRRHHKLAVRMNFTVLRENAGSLPAMFRLARDLDVRLYLNLGTNTTFLFRPDEVADIVDVDGAELDAALRELEELRRRENGSRGKRLPRFSELSYMRSHFTDLLQADLPCAESQLKLMVHSTGEVGGCWGHDAKMNVRERSVASIIDDPYYRDEHTRFYKKDCVGCGSNYSLNLRWRPNTYLNDALWRIGAKKLTDTEAHGV